MRKIILPPSCFDDGYLDNLEYAAPILAKYKVPASFYVVTDCIDQNTSLGRIYWSISSYTRKMRAIDLNF
ncbi:MAG: polysaccharide deacetylase family protein [Bacteroidetes bacterium]|nr:polysaccharide deacetylase family protein [Bacteroidota bacterium]